MTFKQFKISTFLLLATSVVFAQKYDKKFSENFKTNKDVIVNINASNAGVNVTTWNKNEVSVEAVIEIEGLDKAEAEKYFKNWQFEALGNKSKVQINAKSNSFHSLNTDDIIFFNSSKNNNANVYHYNTNGSNVIVLPEMPELPEMPDMSEIEIPEINFEEIVSDLDYMEFDFDKYAKDGENYFFQWKDGVNGITIKSKKEWEKFKKSEKYKKFKESIKKSKETMRKSRLTMLKSRETSSKHRAIAEKSRNKARKNAIEMLQKSRLSEKEYSKEIKEALWKAQESLKNTKLDFVFLNKSGAVTVNGKKVKVTKKITIKVPKNATFDLNTRHCKVKLPKTKASGKVSYGTFNADVLSGGELNISYSPVTINSLNTTKLFLNNVTDAHIVSVANATLNTNSSKLIIDHVYEEVSIKNEFGELLINKIDSKMNNLMVFLNYSNSTINISDIDTTIDVSTKNGKFEFDEKLGKLNKATKDSEGFIRYKRASTTSINKFIVVSNYGDIKLK
ncbi:hypothetical protein [Tenacibaculum bernardetii]|uniref:hypothetical protein n=1 Tax=Tenacibaculum bernardetii TaxID=3021375 RepID=UPI0023AFBD32|nr:hypothetical protein [Tenacibaculum bernardetii]